MHFLHTEKSTSSFPADSLEALEKFIQAQRSALEKTNATIERLKELRSDIVCNPPQTWEDIHEKVRRSYNRV